MHTSRLLAVVSLPLTLIALSASASAVVEDFTLLDHTGTAQELYYQSDAKAIVLMAQNNGCAGVRSAWPELKSARDRLAAKGVRFWMINSNSTDDRASIQKEAADQGYDIPILDDHAQIVGASLNLKSAGETMVIRPPIEGGTQSWQIAYRGALPSAATLDRVLAGTLDEKAMATSTAAPSDCPIDYTTPKQTDSSYSKVVAPILKEKCAVCHSPGGIGPWAMTSYDMIRGFSPMIREVLRTKRMPPWHADPHIGHWEGDRSLTDSELKTLVHWIETGSPRGTGPDPLQQVAAQSDAWPLGQPDLVVDIPGYEVPASGVVDYQFPVVDNPLTEDVWVRAATVIPGDRAVVHHVLVGSSDPETDVAQDRESVFDNYIIGYAPGNETMQMPEGTGVFVPTGGKFLLQMHYTPVGRAVTDHTKVGLYFHKQAPSNFLRHQVVLKPNLSIPPNASDHEEIAYYEFYKDAILYHMVPHAHYRGKASRFELVTPDGKTETLLSVPNYDFNWQRTYAFETPKAVPAGSRLVHRTVYDNSVQNPGNPDPERTVPWGLQSWDEMLYGAFSFAWVDETSANPIHDKLRGDVTQFVGFLDRNMDGKLAWKELPKRMQKRMLQSYKLADRDGDGSLSLEEFLGLRRAAAERRKAAANETAPRQTQEVSSR